MLAFIMALTIPGGPPSWDSLTTCGLPTRQGSISEESSTGLRDPLPTQLEDPETTVSSTLMHQVSSPKRLVLEAKAGANSLALPGAISRRAYDASSSTSPDGFKAFKACVLLGVSGRCPAALIRAGRNVPTRTAAATMTPALTRSTSVIPTV